MEMIDLFTKSADELRRIHEEDVKNGNTKPLITIDDLRRMGEIDNMSKVSAAEVADAMKKNQ